MPYTLLQFLYNYSPSSVQRSGGAEHIQQGIYSRDILLTIGKLERKCPTTYNNGHFIIERSCHHLLVHLLDKDRHPRYYRLLWLEFPSIMMSSNATSSRCLAMKLTFMNRKNSSLQELSSSFSAFRNSDSLKKVTTLPFPILLMRPMPWPQL
jgi:hypothetical protein